MKMNPLAQTDSYKLSHYLQYPPGARYVSSYVEPRGGAYDKVVSFGMQAFVKDKLMKPVTREDVAEMVEMSALHGTPFNEDGWNTILNEYGGYLPLQIAALPEGTVTQPGIPQVQVINTAPGLGWLTSYQETRILRAQWYPSTVASRSRALRGVIYEGLRITADDPDAEIEIEFKLHDFGARGASSGETAMLGGMAHLLSFSGSDTFEGIYGARKFYGADMAGFSLPASEHSTVTSWGRDNEVGMLGQFLDKTPTGLMACVIDSYDAFHFASVIVGETYKDKIMARDGVFVVRPDSGNPTIMPLDIIEVLMEKFGFTVNSKGFRVLPPQVRVIQGDGMNPETIRKLILNAIDRGISVSNFAMGMGGGLLQDVNRDDCKYAMKASAIQIADDWFDVFKDPITDHGKRSKRGVQAVINVDGAYRAVRKDDLLKSGMDPRCNLLRPIYRNGDLLVDESWDTIRDRVNKAN